MKLEVRDLTVQYGTASGALTAVDGVTAGVGPGKTLGLVGESGCGKSSLARGIVGLAAVRGGTILLDGEDFTSRRRRNSRDFRRRVQMVFQDPYSSLNPRMTVESALVEVLPRGPGSNRSSRRRRAASLIDMVGLPSGSLGRYPHQFSGGQRQRIAIARALAVEPEVVIHDEVTSALDVSVQATILNLLKQLQRELELSYIFISHDLSTVRYMSDDVAVMYLGRIVESAPTSRLFGEHRHPYTKALIASIPQVGTPRRPAPLRGELPDPRNPPTGCRFHTRCSVGPLAHPDRTVCTTADPHDTADRDEHFVACHFAEATPVELRRNGEPAQSRL